jgi:hypothetical protein
MTAGFGPFDLLDITGTEPDGASPLYNIALERAPR